MSLGFGIVGLGLIAHFHARAIQALEGARLVACFSELPEEVAAFSVKHQCAGCSSLGELLHQPGLDVVCICTPSGMHLEPALAAAEAGKALVVEKPLEVTLERCDRIIETCARKKVPLAGVFQSRFSPLSQLIRKTIDTGRFGRLVLGDAEVKWFRTQEYYDNGGWRGTWKLDGGGALMNQSIHAIDLLQWYMGPVERVCAFASTLGHERIEVEDTAAAALRFRSGALGAIEGTTSASPGLPKRVEISGTGGTVIQEEEVLKTWSFAEPAEDDEQTRQRFPPDAPATAGAASDPGAISFEGHRLQLEDMVAAMETGREPAVTGREARKAVEIILAIYRSAREGRMVSLPPD